MLITKREYTAARAAAYLARQLNDGRDYGLVLADQRRGKRRECIPFHKDRRGHVFYYESDLLLYIDRERTRGVSPRAEFTEHTEEDEGLLLLHPFYFPAF